VIEASHFNALGLTITDEDFERMSSAFKMTYYDLRAKDKKWNNVEFCKSQLTSLWMAISDYVATVFQEEPEPDFRLESDILKSRMVLNTENEDFAKLLSLYLKKEDATRLLDRLDKIRVGKGSIRFMFNDHLSDHRSFTATVDFGKLSKYIRKNSGPTVNSLRQFVEWVTQHKRLLVTAVLIAGVTVVAIFCAIWAGAYALEFSKLVIPLIIGTVCQVAALAGYFADVDEFLRNLSRFGVHVAPS
jgi:hypoxanthine-guanine phosphoribosyltransferase